MRRRQFITLLGGTAAAWPITARAQQPAMPVIGFLNAGSPESTAVRVTAFRNGLGDAGYVEGQNVGVEYRWADGQYDRLPALAAELARRKVAVIATPGSTIAALAAKAASTTIPIVFSVGADPVQMGLVASLNRPGGNITGVSFLATATASKMLEVLHKAVPDAAVVAALMNPTNPNGTLDEKEVEAAARILGLQFHILEASNEGDIDTAFETMVQRRVGALLIEGDALFTLRNKQLVALTVRHAIPAIDHDRAFTDAGGLMSYGSSLTDSFRQVGVYTGRILKGDKPADLPVQQSTKVELVINITTAKALRLIIPPSVLAIADEVVE